MTCILAELGLIAINSGTRARVIRPTADAVMARLSGVTTDVGLPVRSEVVGEVRPLPPGMELSAYRIVQEALTNVMRHAGAVSRVVVRIRYGEGALVVKVEDDGRPHAGPRPDGGYDVPAVLPLPAEASTSDPAGERDETEAGR